jgi:hypothetical protein
MKFDLLFTADGWQTLRPEAYIEATPSGSYETSDPRAGHILLTNEMCNAKECCQQIDVLIAELEKLKLVAVYHFDDSTGSVLEGNYAN